MPREKANRRVVIEDVYPEVNCGLFAIKRTAGEAVVVEADIYADGHDALSCVLLYRRDEEVGWNEVTMNALGSDRWRAKFVVTELGAYAYTIEGWVDPFQTWRSDMIKRLDAGQDVTVNVLMGANLIDDAAKRASGLEAERLREWARALRDEEDVERRQYLALDEEMAELALCHPDRQLATRYSKVLRVVVDRKKAGFSSWYEMFPRSCALEAGRHGTFADCEKRLPYVASMGFDVLYLPPIHPIGRTHRKGKNNETKCEPEDVGSPWAIGAEEGGHKSIHSDLGSLEDFHRLIAKATEQGLEIAMDIAFQCSADHPYVTDHPEWFRWRPDGTVQYAENPPKKYEDIYPIAFENEDWEGLWEELRDVVFFWIDQGVRIFRVDNPHTKSFRFWEWLIADVKRLYPEVIFLAEAFTRPTVMCQLAKLGFTQSYTYFTWRNTKQEITDYFTELNKTDVREYLRPNLWPNTPDILPETLQFGGRPAFMSRLVLAATLGASYGIYGPAFELCENQAREHGSEEYLNSEKYEIKHRDLNSPWSLKEFIARVNQVRRDNPALHANWNLRFHSIDNEMLLCYSKTTPDMSNVLLTIVTLDYSHTQSGWVNLDLDVLGLDGRQPYQVHDLLGESRYLWHGARNYVELNPQSAPAHIFRLRRKVHTERDFDYYL